MLIQELKTESIPYQDIKYERSNVKFARLPLFLYLEERGLKLPRQFEALVTHMPPGTFIAGGSVAALVNPRPEIDPEPKDIDLFFDGPSTYESATRLLAFASKEVTGHDVPNGVRMFMPPDSDREGLPIQAINFAFFDNGIEQVLDSFDFTVTHFGIDVSTKELVFNPVSPIDYAGLRLLNHRFQHDESSQRRIAKYIGKGFKPVGETAVLARRLFLAQELGR